MPTLNDYEILQDIGDFGLEELQSFEMIHHKMGAGFRRSYLTGSRAGVRAWTLVFKVLLDTLDSGIEMSAGEVESRAEYLWKLFRRSKTGHADVNRPFVIENPGDGKQYLVVFADDVMSRTLFRVKLYSSQLKLDYVRVVGIPTDEDGAITISEI